MSGNALEFLIKATDKASKVIQGVGNEVDKLGGKAASSGGTATTAFGKVAQALSGNLGIALSVGGAITAVGAAVAGTGKFAIGSAQDWAAYNEEMRMLSDSTGAGVEDLSRLIQVGDDLGISQEKLMTAFEMLTKNGISPSIENIATLSDELLAIKDPTDRAEKAAQLFGRGWADISGLVKKGGDEIRTATAAIDDNLVTTTKSVAESRAYTMAVDDLQDAWTGFRNDVGSKTIPLLTRLLSKINQATDEVKEHRDAVEQQTEVEKALADGKTALADGTRIATKEILGEQVAVTIMDGVMRNALTGALIPMTDAEYLLYTQTVNVKEGAFEAIPALAGMANRMVDVKEGALGAVPALRGIVDRKEEIHDALYAIGDAGKEASKGVGGLGDKAASALPQLQNYTKEMLFNKAAAGLDAEAAGELAFQMGLVDRQTLTLMEKMPGLTARYDKNKDGVVDAGEATNDYLIAVRALGYEIDKLKDKTVTVTVKVNAPQGWWMGSGRGSTGGYGEEGYGNNQQRATGGPVREGAAYWVGERGPEVFVPHVGGEILTMEQLRRLLVGMMGAQRGGTQQTWNVTYNEAGRSGSLAGDVAMLRAMAGA